MISYDQHNVSVCIYVEEETKVAGKAPDRQDLITQELHW